MLFERIQLEPDEKLLKTVRKHWFIITVELVAAAFMLIIPFVLLLLWSVLPEEFFTYTNLNLSDHSAMITFFLAGWSILSLMTAFATWTHYYLDLWIITDRRIIVVDQIHFFNRSVSIFRLERLQDIEFSIKGLIPTFLNFGSLHAQTASNNESNFSSRGLPDPRGLQALIQKAMDSRLRKLHITADEAGH